MYSVNLLITLPYIKNCILNVIIILYIKDTLTKTATAKHIYTLLRLHFWEIFTAITKESFHKVSNQVIWKTTEILRNKVGLGVKLPYACF